jgi:hypothetical protein
VTDPNRVAEVRVGRTGLVEGLVHQELEAWRDSEATVPRREVDGRKTRIELSAQEDFGGSRLGRKTSEEFSQSVFDGAPLLVNHLDLTRARRIAHVSN